MEQISLLQRSTGLVGMFSRDRKMCRVDNGWFRLCLVYSLVVNVLLINVVSANDGGQQLAEAVKQQDKAAVRALLKKNVDVNESHGDGATGLHWAAHWNDLDVAELLIEADADVNAVNDLGVTPLQLAAEMGEAVMVEKLLAAGASPDIVAETGVSPLMLASRAGNIAAAESLLVYEANVNLNEKTSGQTALMWAVAQGHPQIVRLLLEHGADVHSRTSTSRMLVNRGGTSTYEDFSAVEYVKTGGSTALFFAAGRGNIECARELVEFGANVNDVSADGNSVLVVAAHSGHGPLAAFFLDRHADPKAAGAGYGVLHAAVLRGDLALVKASLNSGADANARIVKGTPYRRQSADFYLSASMVGATPLIMAAKYGSADIIKALMASGADLTLADHSGTTPLIAAANPNDNNRQPASIILRKSREHEEGRSLQSVRTLLDLGVDVDAVNNAGDTALHIAVAARANSIIKLLAERGAKLGVRNKLGQTALALALSFKGKNEPQPNGTADLLRKLGARN